MDSTSINWDTYIPPKRNPYIPSMAPSNSQHKQGHPHPAHGPKQFINRDAHITADGPKQLAMTHGILHNPGLDPS